ncbi:hypothetical protein OH76DRAFT_1408975 [Lentinus brumalis]|uniref:Uncharacterized protein n=1 Tax=Lentinus brumalis TaxID=2498619 RepID=A0A371CWA0_9APHY|nr:hypothetical protein OH76DRAFT_1408975 [Polyporus brumalis]
MIPARHSGLRLRDERTLDLVKQHGSRPQDGANNAMPKHVFDALADHASLSDNLIMLRITCILSNSEETVVYIPERTTLYAAAWVEPPPHWDIVHHMLIRGSEGAAGIITCSPISMLEPASEIIDEIHVAHVFEAKTILAYGGAGTYVCKELADWCKRTRRRYGKAVIYFASNWRFITYDSAGIPGDDRALYGATGRWRGQWSITLGPREIDTILGLLLDMVCHDLRTLSDDDASSSLQVENASEENLQFIGPI